MPSVRRTVHTPHASTIVATIAARRGPGARRRLATAQATRARHRTGMAYTGSIIPIMPPLIDSWTTRDVATSATVIRTNVPQRSDCGVRLKNAHHTTIANAQTRLPIIATAMAPGTASGMTNLYHTQQHCGEDAGPEPERCLGS